MATKVPIAMAPGINSASASLIRHATVSPAMMSRIKFVNITPVVSTIRAPIIMKFVFSPDNYYSGISRIDFYGRIFYNQLDQTFSVFYHYILQQQFFNLFFKARDREKFLFPYINFCRDSYVDQRFLPRRKMTFDRSKR